MAENHVNMGIAILVPVIVAALFTIHHWYHFEKVGNGGSGRLRTLPFVVSQTWTQFRFLKLIWSGVVKRNKKAWQREKEFLDREIATVKAWVENMPQIVILTFFAFVAPSCFGILDGIDINTIFFYVKWFSSVFGAFIGMINFMSSGPFAASSKVQILI